MAIETDHNAITEEEISGTTDPASASASSPPPGNAFTTLMKRKTPSSPPHTTKKPYATNPLFDRRSGLGAYIKHPESYDISRVIYHTPKVVAINDLYPKSSVHCLLLPRSEKHQLLHPFDAFEDVEFLAEIRIESAKLRRIVGKELQRKYGQFSKIEGPRQAVLTGKIELQDDETCPAGRDWEAEVLVGIHLHPSMNHLHIHVLSKDMMSESMKNRKHYNSFATPFFVGLDEFPFEAEERRERERRTGERELKCWRCGRGFGNKFARLKEHLAEEFEEWKRE